MPDDDQSPPDRLYIDYAHQVIAEVMLGDIQHIVCTYPKVWSERKYYHHVPDDDQKKFQIHCFPQNSILRIHNRELFDVLNEQWTTFDVAKPPRKNTTPGLSPTPTNIDEVTKIVNAVYVLTSLKDPEKERMQAVDEFEHQQMFDVYQTFINQLEHLLREVKRSYRETTERTRVIRGRLSNRGRVNLVMRPSSRFECVFDEFIVQAPIYKIIVTCLEVIMKADFHAEFLWLNAQYIKMRQRGQVHVRTLMGVQSYQRPLARAELRKLQRRLPRRFRALEPILPLMVSILEDESYRRVDDENTASKNSVRIIHQADSSKVWEKFLEKGLERSGHIVQDQAKFNRTWSVGGTKNLDISLNEGVELIDAKYYSKRSEITKAENQHQMFFYLFAQLAKHISQGNARPKRITMIYPLPDGVVAIEDDVESESYEVEDPNIKELLRELGLADAELPPLRLLGVPLPGPDSIQELNQFILHGGDWVKEYFEQKFSIFGDQFYRN